ncbi:MAG TPA: radical SAM protein, partial [Desulfofustis sp.]|nr:radical SAM protein [Desulfofustis sp.]
MTTTGHQHHARTVQFAAGERNVFMHILTACNLSCKHCYINPDQHGTKMLSRERLASWIKLFAPETGTA